MHTTALFQCLPGSGVMRRQVLGPAGLKQRKQRVEMMCKLIDRSGAETAAPHANPTQDHFDPVAALYLVHGALTTALDHAPTTQVTNSSISTSLFASTCC